MYNLKMTESSIVFYIFDDFNRYLNTVILKQNIYSKSIDDESCEPSKSVIPKNYAAIFKVDGYFLSVFIRVLNISPVYFNMVMNHFLNNIKSVSGDCEITAKFQLIKPKIEILDHAWNNRLCNLLVERQELENALSWLSTLGGAFSALGDSFENCAKVAGKISFQQFKIAFQLGDPPLVARCRLYMALSLIQLGKLSFAKNVVQEQYELAKALNDFRLQNMCKGIWAKLQYTFKQKKINYKKHMN